jgi:diguanylate cyclase (GGDEF)-like protein/PAS domain S-box-containing protein
MADVGAVVLLLTLIGAIAVALLSMRIVGRRAARTVEQVNDMLQRNEARFRAMVRDSTDIMAIVDGNGQIVYASPATERTLGLEAEPLVGTSMFDLIHADDRSRAVQRFEYARQGKDVDRLEVRLAHADGSWRIIEAVGTNLLDDPTVQGIVISARDLTERRRAEIELREAQERFRSAFEHAPIGMSLAAIDGRMFLVNRALVQIVGRGESELLASTILDLIHEDDRSECRDAVARLLAGRTASCQLELRYLHHDGHPVWVSLSASLVRDLAGDPLYLVCQTEDITERRANGDALAHQAAHDPLTGLPNRSRFLERLTRELNTAARQDQKVAVLFIDLDRFKVVNDSLGHSAGDRLLVAVADRLARLMGPDDLVGRFGGDEFTILCRSVTSAETVELFAERVARELARPVVLMEGEVFVTTSIGIAMSGGPTDTPETLLRNADAAMYRAKDMGRDRAELFNTHAHHSAVTNLRVGNELHRAIERGEMRMYYQPMVQLSTGVLTGFEALIRWEHPERGLVSPMEFVPLAEETGLIVPLGSWALEESCRQLVRWQQASPENAHLTMSVNLSPRQLLEPGLPGEVARVLHETGVAPDPIWLEITESTLMRDAEAAVGALTALRGLGVHLSVDDFGSGYSSLAYLQQLPVEALKIDRTFVDRIGDDEGSGAIVEAVAGLARALKLKTVAEGIETREQLRHVRAQGVDVGQGYLFGRPQPAAFYGDLPVRAVVPKKRASSPASSPAGAPRPLEIVASDAEVPAAVAAEVVQIRA